MLSICCFSHFSSICGKNNTMYGSNPCRQFVIRVNNITLPVLDGIEGWSYKPVHKVRLLGVVYATMAQLVAQLTCNQWVGGSSPSGGFMNRIVFFEIKDKEGFVKQYNDLLPSEDMKKMIKAAGELFEMLDLFYANKHLYEKIKK